jgi:hypothetical protein
MDDQKLKDYFKFDEDDLQANRNGDFSAKQKKELSSNDSNSIQRRRRAAGIFFILGIILFLMVIVFLIFKGVGYFSQNGALFICPGLGGIAFLLASIYIFRSSFEIRQNYLIKKVEGPINIIKVERTITETGAGKNAASDIRRYSVYELHIGEKTFDVSPDLADIMMQGDTYAIYCSEGSVSNSDEILSLELISKAK